MLGRYCWWWWCCCCGRCFPPPRETQSNSFILYAGFQQREGQRTETERTLVNFVQVAHRDNQSIKREEERSINLLTCQTVQERQKYRKARCPRRVLQKLKQKIDVKSEIKISFYSGNRTQVLSVCRRALYLYTTTTALCSRSCCCWWWCCCSKFRKKSGLKMFTWVEQLSTLSQLEFKKFPSPESDVMT